MKKTVIMGTLTAIVVTILTITTAILVKDNRSSESRIKSLSSQVELLTKNQSSTKTESSSTPSTSKSNSDSLSSNSTSQNVNADTTDWNLFSDSVMGISFKYPKDWSVVDCRDQGNYFVSFGPKSTLGACNSDNSGLISLFIINDATSDKCNIGQLDPIEVDKIVTSADNYQGRFCQSTTSEGDIFIPKGTIQAYYNFYRYDRKYYFNYSQKPTGSQSVNLQKELQQIVTQTFKFSKF